MKKHSLFIIAFSLISLSSFAQKPALNEDFESFNISSNTNSGAAYSSNFKWYRCGDDINLQIVANPNVSGINKSSKVLKLSRVENSTITVENANGQTWRGTTTVSYDLSKGNNSIIEFKVIKNVAGRLAMRLFTDDSKNYVELVTPELAASTEWQTVKFDFTGRMQFPFTPKAYIMIQLEKNSKVAESQSSALEVYIDDVKMIENK